MNFRKITGGLFYLTILIMIFIWRNELILWVKEMDTASWPLILFISAIIGMVPVIPFALVSGMLGIKFGLWGGGGLSVAASTLAAIITYWIFVTGMRSDRQKTSLNRIDHLHVHIRKRSFLFVLIGRMLPFIPAAVINGYAGLFKLPFISFVSATLIGKIPTMFVFAYVGKSAISGSLYWLPVILFYGAFLCVVYILYSKMFGKSNKDSVQIEY
ncbi:TVP38/TMEM64 family protein [Acinetobacter sp. CUI P1]|nr:TVP38/TMEM64 family protein [Acinetobacter sp. CUI P1]